MSVEDQEKQIKKCPFLDQPCIGDECALHLKLQQQVAGMGRVMEVCAIPALVLVMSGRPPQAPPQQELKIPHLRG